MQYRKRGRTKILQPGKYKPFIAVPLGTVASGLGNSFSSAIADESAAAGACFPGAMELGIGATGAAAGVAIAPCRALAKSEVPVLLAYCL